jgi:hypothetical protein
MMVVLFFKLPILLVPDKEEVLEQPENQAVAQVMINVV